MYNIFQSFVNHPDTLSTIDARGIWQSQDIVSKTDRPKCGKPGDLIPVTWHLRWGHSDQAETASSWSLKLIWGKVRI